MIVINLTGKLSAGKGWKCDVVGDKAEVIVKVNELQNVDHTTPKHQLDSNVFHLVQLAQQLDELTNAVIERGTDHGRRYVAISPPAVIAEALEEGLREIGLTPIRSQVESTSNPTHIYWVENRLVDKRKAA